MNSKKSLFQKSLAITFLIGSVAGFGHAQDVSPWKGSEFNLAYYKKFLTKDKCMASQRAFIGCAKATQTLIKGVNPKLDLEAIHSKAGITVKEFRTIKIVELAEKSGPGEDLSSAETAKDIYMMYVRANQNFKKSFGEQYEIDKASGNDPFSGVLSYLEQNYAGKIEEQVIVGAINEYIHVVEDPHSDWRSAVENKKTQSSSETSFVGLGVNFKSVPTGILVENVFENSGAELAGLLVGDVIKVANGVSLGRLSQDDVVKIILGAPGTELKLEFSRNGQNLSVTAIRKKVSQQIVTARITELYGKKIGIIGLKNFVYQNGCTDISSHLQHFNLVGVSGAILDLRGNGGGSVAIANCIAGLFIGPKKLITLFEERDMAESEDADKPMELRLKEALAPQILQAQLALQNKRMTEQQFKQYIHSLQSREIEKSATFSLRLRDQKLEPSYSTGDQVWDKPLTILIDAGSASASELISGAFRDLNRALIIGQTSFGKGSKQNLTESNSVSQLWKTTGLFFQPSGTTNQTTGVKPHVAVFKDLAASESELYALREKDIFMFPLEPRILYSIALKSGQMNILQAPTACIEGRNVKGTYAGLEKKSKWRDMQVLTAAAALSCQ